MDNHVDLDDDILKHAKKKQKWIDILKGDPRLDLLFSDESYTVYRTLTSLLDIDSRDKRIEDIRLNVVSEPKIVELVNLLPDDWSSYLVKSHARADYPPSLLRLLFDFGIRPSDFQKIEDLLNQMENQQDASGKFTELGQFPRSQPTIGASLCGTHVTTEVLIISGRKDNQSVQKSLKRITEGLTDTDQGLAWLCEPHTTSNQRGPGRKNDMCPIATLEALRVFSLLEPKERPNNILEAGYTLLSFWEKRKEHKPYLFGQGRKFRDSKPPYFWYDAMSVMDTLSRYPEFFKEPAFKELIEVILENTDSNGRIVPKSVYRDFKNWSFGQKKQWSPWATMYLCRIIKRIVSHH